MESGTVTGAVANGIDDRIQETDRRLSTIRSLLVDERHETGPQGRGDAGSTDGTLYAAAVEHCHAIGNHRDVRNIAHGSGALIVCHGSALLPSRDRIGGADAAASADVAASVPNAFRGI